jgi:hypothetical protein
VIELWFVTPAYQRFELSELCFRQRRRMIDALATHGVDAHCVVVADDENVELARAAGFDVVEHNNKWLGAKFSAGYNHALAAGATHLLPIGSDSWMAPGLVACMPFYERACTGTAFLSTLRADGRERLDLTIDYGTIGFGVATLYPRAAFAGERFPCAPNIRRGCDTSTWNRTARAKGMALDKMRWHHLEYTDFKSYENQTTDYRRLKARHECDVTGGDAAIDDLRDLYDDDLVDRLRKIYSSRPAWTD